LKPIQELFRKASKWCLRRILNIHWSKFVTNDEIRSRTGQPFLSDTVRSRRLSFIGHLYRADPGQDHHRALQACIAGPPDNWRRRIGRPRQSWLRTVEPATYESWTGDRKATRSGPIGLAETRGNGYVVSDTLLKKKKQESQSHNRVWRTPAPQTNVTRHLTLTAMCFVTVEGQQRCHTSHQALILVITGPGKVLTFHDKHFLFATNQSNNLQSIIQLGTCKVRIGRLRLNRILNRIGR